METSCRVGDFSHLCGASSQSSKKVTGEDGESKHLRVWRTRVNDPVERGVDAPHPRELRKVLCSSVRLPVTELLELVRQIIAKKAYDPPPKKKKKRHGKPFLGT